MKTYQPKAKDVKREWHFFDAKDEILGRLSTKIATILMGKNKAAFSKHMDQGDFVVVTNAKKIKLTGKKEEQKVYQKHSGYPGGFKEVKYAKLIAEKPERVLEHAVAGMLPKNRLQSERMKRLKVYADDKHPYGDKFQITNAK